CVPARVATDITAGERHSCAITAPGWLWCWGDRLLGQAGLPYSDTMDEPTPQRIGAAADWTAIDGDFLTTCGIHGGTAVCMGSNTNSVVGIPESSMRNVFTAMTPTGVPSASAIESGFNHVV